MKTKKKRSVNKIITGVVNHSFVMLNIKPENYKIAYKDMARILKENSIEEIRQLRKFYEETIANSDNS